MSSRPHLPREGSHGVQWGLLALLVFVAVATGVFSWKLGMSNQIAGTSWVLAELPQSDVEIASHTVTASFTKDELAGQSSVNSYRSEYSAGGTILKIDDIAVTSMAGPEDAMAVEGAYLDALARVTAYIYDVETLTLLDPDGLVFVVFERAE